MNRRDFPTQLRACIDPARQCVATADYAQIEAGAELAPCGGVIVQPGCDPELHGFGAASVILEQPQATSAAAPPTVEWELRGAFGGRLGSELIAGASGGLSKFTAWQGEGSEGSIVHVSGRRYMGFELWARCDGSENIRCRLRFVLAPASAGCPLYVEPGGLV